MIWFDSLALKAKVRLRRRGQQLCIKCRTGLIAQPWRQVGFPSYSGESEERWPASVLSRKRDREALTQEPVFGGTERNEKSGERIV